jgi:hypothetical protein
MNTSTPEPAPLNGTGGPLWPLVIARHHRRPAFVRAARQRHEFGVAKYGTALRANNGRNAKVDALQEALDLVVYLEQILQETDDRAEAMRVRGMQDVAVDLAQELALMVGA